MAQEYCDVLRHIGVTNLTVVGRTEEGAARFSHKNGLKVFSGGIDVLVPLKNEFNAAIVAVSHTEAYDITTKLLSIGIRHLLIEKPGALYQDQLSGIDCMARKRRAKVYVAFNRRFYKSVDTARQIIQDDGGLLSINFDFTEVERLVLEEQKRKHIDPRVLERWGVVNSLHVIDLFVYFAGAPKSWTHRTEGALPWHQTGARFCGSGISKKGALFAYVSSWDGGGRWGVEMATPKKRLILRPLERLRIQDKGQFGEVELDCGDVPAGFKAGLYGQVRTFLEALTDDSVEKRLCSVGEALDSFRTCEKIMNYS
jgi:predicted dehydrogenase